MLRKTDIFRYFIISSMSLSKFACDSLFLMSAVNADVRHSLNLNAKYLLLDHQSLPSIFFHLSNLVITCCFCFGGWLCYEINGGTVLNLVTITRNKEKLGHFNNNNLRFSLLIILLSYGLSLFGTLLLCISAPGNFSSVEGRFENYITKFYRRKSKQQSRSRRQGDTKQ